MKKTTWILLLFALTCNASQGDRSVWYGECTRHCRNVYNCSGAFGTFDWVHGECFWCRYDCMWDTVEQFERNYGFIPQFHGKWPFLAVSLPFGFVVQEPASVIFSLLNMLSVFFMLKSFQRIQNLENRKMWITYSKIGLVTWLCSTIFHTIDCDLTEKMDYLGAFTFVISAFYVSLILTFGSEMLWLQKFLPYAMGLKFVSHVKTMMENFDYGYNMKVCIATSILTTICYLWLLFTRKRRLGNLEDHHYLLIRIIVWANLSTALELLDFTPVFWIIDSHSLFHLATIPIPIWWAEFMDRMSNPHKYRRDLTKLP